jgi:hypothetical protein
MKPDEDILAFLLKLNLELADKEAKGESITPPGLPSNYPDPQKLVTVDCIRPEGEDDSTTESTAAAAHHYFLAKEAGPPYRGKK